MKPKKIKHNSSLRSISRKQNAFKMTDSSFYQQHDRRLKTENTFRNPLSVHKDNSFIVTKKAKMYHKEKSGNFEDSFMEGGASNLEKLKREAQILDNEGFLGKVRCDTEDSMDYIRRNQFASSKKASLIDRYRLNIKKLAKRKDFTFIHLKGLSDLEYRPSFSLKQEDVPLFINTNQGRKKQTPSIVKRYFRPAMIRTCKSNIMVSSENQIVVSSAKKTPRNDQLFMVCL